MEDLQDFRPSQRIHGDCPIIVASHELAWSAHTTFPTSAHLSTTISSSAKSSLPPYKRWMVTELTILPPNLWSSTSGDDLLLRYRVDADSPSKSPEVMLDHRGSRSRGSALSTSVWKGASPWTCIPPSPMRMKAHSPFSGPPTIIQPYPATRQRGSNGITATLSRFCSDICIEYTILSTTT